MGCRKHSREGASAGFARARCIQLHVGAGTCPNPAGTLVSVVEERTSAPRTVRVPVLTALIGACGTVIAALVAGLFTLWRG